MALSTTTTTTKGHAMTTTTYTKSNDLLEASNEFFDIRFRRRPYNAPWRAQSAKPRIYVGMEDWTLLEDLENRFRRPHAEFRKFIERVVWPTLGWETLDLKLVWSQKAGCSCGCSPGFIMQSSVTPLLDQISRYFDCWITIKDLSVPSVDTRKPARVLALA